MPVTLKTRDGGQISCAVQDISNIDRLPYYDEITFLDVSHHEKCRKRDDYGFAVFPPRLPNNLQILIFSGNAFTTLPPLPGTLRAIHGNRNKLTELPDIAHLSLLETVDLSSNDVSCVDGHKFPQSLKKLDLSDNLLHTFTVAVWPENLLELNLSTNRLTSIDPAFDTLNALCKVSLAYNNFPSQKHNAYTLWIDPEIESEESIAEKLAITARHTRFGVTVRVRTTLDHSITLSGASQPLLENTRAVIDNLKCNRKRRNLHTTYDNSQNVHTSSIQNSTNAAITWLIANTQKKTSEIHQQEYVDLESNTTVPLMRNYEPIKVVPAWKKLSRAWRPRHFYQICKWLKTRRANQYLKRDVRDETIHSVHGLTYAELIKLIWHAVEHHEHREDILNVLKQEIIEGQHLCFTGRFTRALNALSGFIEQVTVEISENEQMSNRIVQALRGLQDTLKEDTSMYETQGRKLVANILQEFHIAEGEWAVWLDAV